MLDTKMWNFHICCLVLGFLLLATSLKHVQGAETIIYSNGGTESFVNYMSSKKCELKLHEKTVCSYEYGAGTTPPLTEICDEIQFNLNTSYGICRFDVNIANKSLSGIYTLKYTMTNGTEGVETYHVYSLTGSVPAGYVQVVENENIYLLLEDSFGSESDRKCEVVYSNGTHEIVKDSSWGTEDHWGTKDECGFKIEGVSTSDEDVSKLRMSSRDAAFTYAIFSVTVTPLNEFDTAVNSSEWVIGEDGTLKSDYQKFKYCEFWNPQKKMVQHESSCSYTQKFVTDVDEGDWTLVFGIDGKILEGTIVQEIIVKKSDVLQVNVSNSERFPGGKSLLCSLNLKPVADCSFTRPDGKVILPSDGIWNADYSYHGDGLEKGDCGLTIHEVQEEDKGLWKCIVSDKSTQTQRSAFMNVSTDVPDLEVDTNGTQVVATNPPELALSCSAQTALDYCWFRHPSGLPLPFSTVNVPMGDNILRYYKYKDTLSQGVCTVTIQPPITKDSGEWICNLGLLGSPNEDIAVPITVGISETDVVSLVKEVVVSEGSVLLKCYSIPLEVPLDYCRFIRPDGKGFNVVPQNNEDTVLGRYRYEADGLAKGECGLRIVSGINVNEDLGKWTCVARLQGRKNEGYDFIDVRSGGLSTRAIIGIVLGSVALLVV